MKRLTVPLRAALYLRVSTARQAEHDVSIPHQRRQGETYRCAVALWHRWDAPPLQLYQGTVSLCRIDGPSISDESGYRPAGGLVETPGLTANLSPDEAHDLDNRIKAAIETAIRAWADETNRGHWKALPQHQHRGAKDA